MVNPAFNQQGHDLLNAIRQQNSNRVGEILETFDVNQRINDVGMTPLAYACANSDNQGVFEAIFAKNPDVNVFDYTGRTPLHHSARRLVTNAHAIEINIEIIRYLLESGADKEARTRGRETPLMDAVRGNKIAVLAALLNGGCFPEKLNGLGQSALDLAGIHFPEFQAPI